MNMNDKEIEAVARAVMRLDSRRETGTFLTSQEVRDLTGRVQFACQEKALRSMGIEHRSRPDGSIVILRAHVEQMMGGAVASKRKMSDPEPNWKALNAARA